MFSGMIRFHKGLWHMPWQWQIWLALLMTLNMFVPLFYLQYAEAVYTLMAALAAAVMMFGLTGKFGFTRILGLGHIVFWLPLLIYLAGRLQHWPADESTGLWLRVLMVCNGISLLIDGFDVLRFLRGDKQEVVSGLN